MRSRSFHNRKAVQPLRDFRGSSKRWTAPSDGRTPGGCPGVAGVLLVAQLRSELAVLIHLQRGLLQALPSTTPFDLSLPKERKRLEGECEDCC